MATSTLQNEIEKESIKIVDNGHKLIQGADAPDSSHGVPIGRLDTILVAKCGWKNKFSSNLFIFAGLQKYCFLSQSHKEKRPTGVANCTE